MCEYYWTQDALYSYSCDEGTLSGSSCIIETQYEFQISVVAGYYQQCNEIYGGNDYRVFSCACTSQGGKIYGDSSNYACYKTKETVKDASIEYFCPSETELYGTLCVKKFSVVASYRYVCPEGYIKNGLICEK